MQMVDLPDSRGHFGPYGGVFVAETLMHALAQLRQAYEHCRADAAFHAELRHELKHFVGRPSPVYHARRWSERLLERNPADREAAALQQELLQKAD